MLVSLVMVYGGVASTLVQSSDLNMIHLVC